jgi:hypothetical protein
LLRKLYCLTVRTLRKWVFPTCYILLTCCRWWHLIRYHHPTIFACHIISVPNKKRRYQFYCAWSVSGITFINYAVYRNISNLQQCPIIDAYLRDALLRSSPQIINKCVYLHVNGDMHKKGKIEIALTHNFKLY